MANARVLRCREQLIAHSAALTAASPLRCMSPAVGHSCFLSSIVDPDRAHPNDGNQPQLFKFRIGRPCGGESASLGGRHRTTHFSLLHPRRADSFCSFPPEWTRSNQYGACSRPVDSKKKPHAPKLERTEIERASREIARCPFFLPEHQRCGSVTFLQQARHRVRSTKGARFERRVRDSGRHAHCAR